MQWSPILIIITIFRTPVIIIVVLEIIVLVVTIVIIAIVAFGACLGQGLRRACRVQRVRMRARVRRALGRLLQKVGKSCLEGRHIPMAQGDPYETRGHRGIVARLCNPPLWQSSVQCFRFYKLYVREEMQHTHTRTHTYIYIYIYIYIYLIFHTVYTCIYIYISIYLYIHLLSIYL